MGVGELCGPGRGQTGSCRQDVSDSVHPPLLPGLVVGQECTQYQESALCRLPLHEQKRRNRASYVATTRVQPVLRCAVACSLFEEGKNSTCASFEDLSIDDTLYPSLAHSTVFRFFPPPQSSCPFVSSSTSLPQSTASKDISCSPLCATAASSDESPLSPLPSPCYATSAVPLIQPHPGREPLASSEHQPEPQSSSAGSVHRPVLHPSLLRGAASLRCSQCSAPDAGKCSCDNPKQGAFPLERVPLSRNLSRAAGASNEVGQMAHADGRCFGNAAYGGLTDSSTGRFYSAAPSAAVYTYLPLDSNANSLLSSPPALSSGSGTSSSFPAPPFRLPAQSVTPHPSSFLSSLFSSSFSSSSPTSAVSSSFSRRGGKASGWIRLDMWVRQRQTAPDAILYAQVTESALLVVSPAAALRAAHLVVGALQPIERAYLLSKMETRAAEAVRRQERYLADLMVGNVSHACADICVVMNAPCRVLLPFQENVPESPGFLLSCGRFCMDTSLQLPRILGTRKEQPDRTNGGDRAGTSGEGGTPVSSLRIWGSQAWGAGAIRKKAEETEHQDVPFWWTCPERIYDRYGFACSDCAIMRVGDTEAFLKLMPFACSCSTCGELLAAISGSRRHVEASVDALTKGTTQGGAWEGFHSYGRNHAEKKAESGSRSRGNCCCRDSEASTSVAERTIPNREAVQERRRSNFGRAGFADCDSSSRRGSRPVSCHVGQWYPCSAEETGEDSRRKKLMSANQVGLRRSLDGREELTTRSSRQRTSLRRNLEDDELDQSPSCQQPQPVYLLYPSAFRLSADICHLTRAEGCPALRLLFRDDSLIG